MRPLMRSRSASRSLGKPDFPYECKVLTAESTEAFRGARGEKLNREGREDHAKSARWAWRSLRSLRLQFL